MQPLTIPAIDNSAAFRENALLRSYRSVLVDRASEDLIRYLGALEYIRVDRANMRVWKSLQGDNTGNEKAAYLVNVLTLHGFQSYLKFDDLVVIKYECGKDHVDWHTDGGIYMEPHTEIASLSLGSPRMFEYRAIADHSYMRCQPVENNSLLVMGRTFQSNYEHRIPPCESVDPRYGIVLFTHKK